MEPTRCHSVLLRDCRRNLSSSNSVVLLASRDRRLRALLLALRVPSTTFALLRSFRGSIRPSRLASSSSKISAITKDPRSRCSSSSRLNLRARWVRLLSRPLVALVVLPHMREILLTPVRQSPKRNK